MGGLSANQWIVGHRVNMYASAWICIKLPDPTMASYDDMKLPSPTLSVRSRTHSLEKIEE